MLTADARPVVDALLDRMNALGAQGRYEDAAAVRDRLLAFVRGAARAQRLDPLARTPEVVAARPGALGGWEVVCIRYGRFAGTTLTPRGANQWLRARAAWLDGARPLERLVDDPATVLDDARTAADGRHG